MSSVQTRMNGPRGARMGAARASSYVRRAFSFLRRGTGRVAELGSSAPSFPEPRFTSDRRPCRRVRRACFGLNRQEVLAEASPHHHP